MGLSGNAKQFTDKKAASKQDNFKWTTSVIKYEVGGRQPFPNQMLDTERSISGLNAINGEAHFQLNVGAKFEIEKVATKEKVDGKWVDKVDEAGNKLYRDKKKFHFDYTRRVGFDTVDEAEDFIIEMADVGVYGWFQVVQNPLTGKYCIRSSVFHGGNQKSQDDK